MDRGYIDFARLYAIHLLPAFFVVRAKSNLRFHRLSSIRSERSRGVRGDQVISLVGYKSRTGYPESLRRIAYVDAEKKKRLVFLTNLFNVPPQMIADAYRKRWQVELFFKWIKQHLRIKAFYGTSANAVKTQIWIAVIVYLIVVPVFRLIHPPIFRIIHPPVPRPA
jgi:IS4 transposase